MRDYPGRRYPPTPYGVRTEATRLYRNGWDEGWDETLTRPWWMVREHYQRLTGPEAHGYYDGVQAALHRLDVIAEAERRQRRIDAAADREERRRAGEGEAPY